MSTLKCTLHRNPSDRIPALKGDLEKNGFKVLNVVHETYEADAEITLENGITISLTEDGFMVVKELPNGKFLTYSPRWYLDEILSDIRKEVK